MLSALEQLQQDYSQRL
ncbi:MbeD/MobD family mobilization/exclusion protein, partial [Klebsiella oxytoca]